MKNYKHKTTTDLDFFNASPAGTNIHGDYCTHDSVIFLPLGKDRRQLGLSMEGLPEGIRLCMNCAANYMNAFNVANGTNQSAPWTAAGVRELLAGTAGK